MSLYRQLMHSLERDLLLYCMRSCNYVAKDAAKAYGMNYRNMIHLLGKHQLLRRQGFNFMEYEIALTRPRRNP